MIRILRGVTALALLLFLVADSGSADVKNQRDKPRRVNPALRPIAENPKLPNVLLIGDSISIGYTLPVRQLLDGKANVHRPKANCGPTTRGLEQLDRWLGDRKWDVIHFNWGLHDLKYLGPKGQNLADPKAPASRQQVPPKQYENNVRKLVERLKKTGATLIWCSTTPVAQGAKGRVVGDSAKYNAIASKVMKEHGIATNDLYSFANQKLDKIQRRADVHFTKEGSKELARQVAAAIEKVLEQRETK